MSDQANHLTDFDTFFRKYYAQLKNYLIYKTGDAEVARDLAQECFIKVWENRAKIKMGAAPSYLYSTANNLTMNHFRHARVVFNFASQKQRPGHDLSPQYLLEQKEFDERLQQAINDLSEKQRLVFLMNRIDDLTYAEIAVRLGISQKAVEKRMHGALDKLRAVIPQKF